MYTLGHPVVYPVVHLRTPEVYPRWYIPRRIPRWYIPRWYIPRVV